MTWAKLAHKATGEIVWVDSHQARLSRVRRRVLAWAAHVQADFADVNHRLIMLTLTYREVGRWGPKHISEFMYWLRERWKLCAYCWVAELQVRGAVHYHVLAAPSVPFKRLKPDRMKGWKHGATRVEEARSPYYAAKYTQKGSTNEGAGHRFPKGLRVMACWSSRRDADSITARNFRMSTHPAWVRALAASSNVPVGVRRAPGGGYEIGGDVVAGPYALIEVVRVKPDGVK